MIGIGGHRVRLCDGISRRDVLRVGALGVTGLALPDLLRAEAAPKKPATGRAKSCILFFLMGGQAQVDTWDMKPDAPEQVRGEFNPIKTNVPGIRICEHMPRLAQSAHRYAILRSVNHTLRNHAPAGYLALSGADPPGGNRDPLGISPDDYPNPGGLAAMKRPSQGAVPSYVQLSPPLVGDNGLQMPGLSAGFLGSRHDPLKIIQDPNLPDFTIDELSLPQGVNQARLDARRTLLNTVEKQFPLIGESPEIAKLDEFYRRAYALVTSPASRRAFDISQEPAAVRDRYGRFTYGQQLLLARRLVESGVRLVTVVWGGALNSPKDYWDTHKGNFPKQKDYLLPQFDQCFSALLEDLDQRGMLDETLVVGMGEFGRTPRVGQVVMNGGTDKTGRDHWPFCYSVVFAGGGVRGGQVIGASDEHGAYPADRAVTPADVIATIYTALGIDPHTEVFDTLKRPLPATRGESIPELFT